MCLLALLFFSIVPGYSQELSPAQRSFDPAKGFKPAQRDLTEIYLQLAESLQVYGSPVPYLRHVKGEHDRIRALYRMKFGREPADYCPKGIDAEWLKGFSSNWDTLSPKLGLDTLTKDIGRKMASAINGSRGNGTIVIESLNTYQEAVFNAMSKGNAMPPFSTLQSQTVVQLGLDGKNPAVDQLPSKRREAVEPAQEIKASLMKLFQRLDAALEKEQAESLKEALLNVFIDTALMADSELKAGIMEWGINPAVSTADAAQTAGYSPEKENGLTEAEKLKFAALLRKDKFSKADLAELDRFYKTSYDKLSERGKDELSKRIWGGVRGK